MAKTITRSDVLDVARSHSWVGETQALDKSVALVPVRDVLSKGALTLSVSWNETPFSHEPRFAFAILEGAGLPVSVPNIVGTYRAKDGIGACVIAILNGTWQP